MWDSPATEHLRAPAGKQMDAAGAPLVMKAVLVMWNALTRGNTQTYLGNSMSAVHRGTIQGRKIFVLKFGTLVL